MDSQECRLSLVATFVRGWLESRDNRTRDYYAIATAFTAYFCMYAFRKPFAAATYEGPVVSLLGSDFQQKTLFVVSQILGYAISKYLGVRVCSETSRRMRFRWLVGLVLLAECALILFGLAPQNMPVLKVLAIFANGLPLGMVWGLVVLYLEGRRTSELLLTGLSCSFIVASGIVKDVGRALLAGASFPLPTPESWNWAIPNPFPPISDFWMPAATGSIFLAPFVLSVWLLNLIPEPTERDRMERTCRQPMMREDRLRFVRRYAVGIFAALAAYTALTAYRDYRDNYVVEAYTDLGYNYEGNKAIVSRTELMVAFGVMATLSQLYRIRDNRFGLIAIHGVMAFGLLLTGGATLLLDRGLIDGFWWMTLIGLGAYLAYVPFNAMLFDRVIASTGFIGTAVFGIYLADAVGYSGSVGMQIGKDVIARSTTHLDFLRAGSYLLATAGALCLVVSCYAFLRHSNSSDPPPPSLTTE